MEILDELAVDEHDGLALFFGFLMRRDDLLRVRELLGRWRVHLVAWLHLRRMDERLAVEAELEALQAGGLETVHVLEVQVNAIEDRDVVRARREQTNRKRRQHREPLARVTRVKILGEVARAHDE